MRNEANRPRTRRLRALAAVACTVPVLSLSACGFDAQTNQVYQPAEGSNARQGDVLILNAVIVADGSGQGTLSTTLSNPTLQGDRLTEVSGQLHGGQVPGRKVVGDVGFQMEMPQPVKVPPMKNVQTTDLGITARAKGLVPGEYTTLTFSFERAGTTKLDVPVVEQSAQFADVPVG